MNLKSPSHIKLIVLCAAALIVLSVAGLLTYRYFTNQSEHIDTGGTTVEPAPSTLNDQDAAAKQQFIEDEAKKDASSGSDDSGVRSSGTIELVATRDGDTATVTTKITSIGDGTCKLNITNGSKTYAETADIIYQSSYSTCAGFSIPTSRLGGGLWNITITSTSLEGVTTSGSTTLEVQ